MSQPISPDPAYGAREGSLPAYVSNGLIGLRIREMPLAAGQAIVNGVAGEHPEHRVEAVAPVPYPLSADIGIDGVSLAEQPWTASDFIQSYDFATGELTSRFTFAAAGRIAHVEVLTFASRTEPSLVLQEVLVGVDSPCDLTIRASVETGAARGTVVKRWASIPGEEESDVDGSILWQTQGALAQCGLALLSYTSEDCRKERLRPWDNGGSLATEYRLRATPARKVRLRQLAALLPSILHARPDEEARRRVAKAQQTGFEGLRERNRGAWAEIWRSRVTVDGASREHQGLIDAATFYLNSSVHPASPAATSIFGLASWPDYHYYFGHVMWDIEAFCLAPLTLMQPDAARALLDFRHRSRRAARTCARLSNRNGLQYPWEASPHEGQEAAPGTGSAAAHEDHVSLHVARAFSLYADLTGDGRYLRDKSWPVLSGVADWIVSRVTWTERGAELRESLGPAEVERPPDNDAFTLMGAADVLRRAIAAAGRVGEDVPEGWPEVLNKLYLPRRSDGVIASHDGFRIDEPKGATPSPLAGFFPLDFPAGEAERDATLEFFLKRWRDYVGAPMLPALYCVWAALAKDRKLALQLFEEGYAAYDAPRFHQCLEYRPDHPDCSVPAGPFFANLGGMLMGVLFGLAGLVIDGGDPLAWPRRPVILPQGWKAIEVERLWIHGRALRLEARHGADRALLSWL